MGHEEYDEVVEQLCNNALARGAKRPYRFEGSDVSIKSLEAKAAEEGNHTKVKEEEGSTDQEDSSEGDDLRQCCHLFSYCIKCVLFCVRLK